MTTMRSEISKNLLELNILLNQSKVEEVGLTFEIFNAEISEIEIVENDYSNTTKQSRGLPFLSVYSAWKKHSARNSQYELGSLCCFYGQVMSDQANYVWCHVSQAHIRRKKSVSKSVVIE